MSWGEVNPPTPKSQAANRVRAEPELARHAFFSQQKTAGSPLDYMISNRMISCTLLVPPDLFRRVVAYYPVANVLRSLLLRYEWKAQGRHQSKRTTTQYQRPASGLDRVDFRVSPILWHQLGCYARVLGVSRCHAFTLLMEADAANVPVGTPAGRRWRKNWRRHYLLYYEIIGLGASGRTLIRRRKYIDDAFQAKLKRIYDQFEPER